MTANSAHDSGSQVVTVRLGKEHYATHVSAFGHDLMADEPEDLGGTDLGPTPKNLLLSSLGACTAITVRMYADRKNWPLEEIDVELTQTQVHASECVDCGLDPDAKGSVTILGVKIEFKGELLTEEMKSRLLEIAQKCPVHRTIVDTTVIKTELKTS